MFSSRSRQAAQADFEALFNQHWDRLCRAAAQITGDPDEAEDLALEAFLQYHNRPPARDENPGGWLYRTVTNLALNALRTRRRREHYEQAAALESEPPEDAARLAERRMEQRRVRETLAALPSRTAQLLVPRHTGLSYAEIATALQVAPGSVGTLLARAEKDFEQLYHEYK